MKQFKYKATFEVEASLQKKSFKNFQTSASVKELKELRSLLPSDEYMKEHDDLLFCSFNLAVAGMINKNNHGILAGTAERMMNYWVNRPLNIEHDRSNTVGCIINTGFSTFGENKMISLKEAIDSNMPFNLCMGGVVWKVVDPYFAEYLEMTNKDTDEDNYLYGKVATSWEVGFNKYLIAKGSRNLFEAEIISDEEEIDKMSGYLTQFGGTGKDENDSEYYLVISGDARPLGGGFTENPAAEVKHIFIPDLEEGMHKTNEYKIKKDEHEDSEEVKKDKAASNSQGEHIEDAGMVGPSGVVGILDDKIINSLANQDIVQGDYVEGSTTEGVVIGQVEHIMYEGGVHGIPGSKYSIESTPEDPAMAVRVFKQEGGTWMATPYSIGMLMSDAEKIDLENQDLIASKDVYKPTDGMKTAAARALRWKAEGKANGAGTPVGWGRATDIVAGRAMSLSVVKRMYSFFSRHEVDKKGKDFDNLQNPSNGRIMWDAWGGDGGFTWSAKIANRAKNASDSIVVNDPIKSVDTEKNKNIISQDKKITVRHINDMKFKDINDFCDKYAEACVKQEVFAASEVREFIQDLFFKEAEGWKSKAAEQEEIAKVSSEKVGVLEIDLASAQKDALDTKVALESLREELAEIRANAEKSKKEDDFNKRMSALDEKYNFDEKTRKKIAKDIFGLAEADYKNWLDEDGDVILAGKEKGVSDSPEKALKEVKSSTDFIPNAGSDKEPLRENKTYKATAKYDGRNVKISLS